MHLVIYYLLYKYYFEIYIITGNVVHYSFANHIAISYVHKSQWN